MRPSADNRLLSGEGSQKTRDQILCPKIPEHGTHRGDLRGSDNGVLLTRVSVTRGIVGYTGGI